jgi:hypothetical protein
MDNRWRLAFFLLPALVAFSADDEGKDAIGGKAAESVLGNSAVEAELPSFSECETGCNNMGSGSNLEHYCFWDLGGDVGDPEDGHLKWHWEGLPDDWRDWHEECEPSEEVPEEDIEELALALAAEDMDATVALFDGLADRVFLNSERSMVQAFGCTGLIVASLPLSFEQLRALQD